ncbi:NAD-dependent protein deacetylase [Parahalioglobus pacificus]|uniref:NAD-dependent protein deacetylase n=1 Tax=Parahalioglobus pacificus TaxID=930806 RepID=UPI00167AD23C|nr:NAD-dependent protein deacetylase [Halioglobus pacificus]
MTESHRTSTDLAGADAYSADREANQRCLAFIRAHPTLTVLTGAGISADSGIPTYRDAQGTWLGSNPIQHQNFLNMLAARRRYWARSMLGWPPVRDARPNVTHRCLAWMESKGHIDTLITQNVDRLHQRAGSERVIDLHGRLDQVVCLGCGQETQRETMQQRLLQANPDSELNTVSPRPDGDADVSDERVAAMQVPACSQCAGTLKPDVVFFGGSVPRDRVEAGMAAIERSDALLVLGSSLKVYSGYRFCKQAAALGKPIAIINRGVTRGDDLANLKLNADCGSVLAYTVQAISA